MAVSDKRLVWIMLSLFFSCPNNRLWEIMKNYSSAAELYDDLINRRCGFITEKEAEHIGFCSEAQGLSVIKSCEKRGIYILTYEDNAYPERLRKLYCPPAVLYFIGDISSLNCERTVAVIGAREASEYSLKAAYAFTNAIAKRGICIISGLANGIDQIAHKSALKADGMTCGVMGCGLEYDYPKGSGRLKEAICRKGTVISEYMPQTRPAPENFKVRNRIIAALSDAVIVIQASEHSGTLNTVNHALELSKEIFVIPPHDILSDDYTGQSVLIEEGATPLYRLSQILDSI